MFSAGGICFSNTATPKTPDTPSHWMTSIAVDDIDLACEKVMAHKGTVHKAPYTIPTVEQVALVSDPVGTRFDIYAPENKGREVSVVGGDLGQVCWVELMVDDPAPLIPFYSEIFNWKIDAGMEMNGGHYRFIEAGGKMAAGIFTRPADAPKMPPAWIPYFAVSDIKKYTEEARSLGATIHMDSVEIPDTGLFSGVSDPTGAFFYIFEDKSVKQ